MSAEKVRTKFDLTGCIIISWKMSSGYEVRALLI